MRSTTKLLVVYVMIIVDSGKEREVINKIKKFPGVTEVKSVYGEYKNMNGCILFSKNY